MDIEHSPRVAHNETRRQHPHEAGKQNEVRMAGVNAGRKCRFEAVAVRVIAMIDDCRGNAMRFGDRKPTDVRHVTDDLANVTREIRVQQRFEIAPAAGEQNDDPFRCAHAMIVCGSSAFRRSTVPMR